MTGKIIEGVRRKNGRRGKRWRDRERVRKSNEKGGAGGKGCDGGEGGTERGERKHIKGAM